MATRKDDALQFVSDRLRLFGPLITPRVIELARTRVMSGESFFNRRDLTVPDSKGAVKLALLVAHEMNPYEDFGAEEEALMRGISAATLAGRKKDELLRPL